MREREEHDPGRLRLEDLLACSVWYAALPQDAQAWVSTRAFECRVLRGESLARQGEIPAFWFGLVEGLLKWSVLTPEGHAVTLGGILPGCWFGEGSLLRGRPRQGEIVALRDSRVALLAQDDFAQLLQTQPVFKDFILQQINERLHYFMGHVADTRLLKGASRVAHALCGLMHPLNNPLNLRRLRISQDEMAALTSVSRQRCNQALAHMREQGWIRTEYGGITLLELEPIQRMARETQD